MNMACCFADNPPTGPSGLCVLGQPTAAVAGSSPRPELPGVAGKTDWPWQPCRSVIPCSRDAGGWPRISVITPSFNQGQYLEETLRSVLLQGYPNLEFIVIDGGSTDGSREILQRYSPWLDCWVSESDHGQAHALNKGFARATGDWLTWLNSDDLFMPDALWTVAEAIRSHSAVDWVVGTTIVTDAGLQPLRRFEPVCGSDDWLDFLCNKRATGTSLPQPGSFWSRRAWDAAGPLDETLCYVMDYEYWARLARHGYRPALVDANLAMFRLAPNSKSGSGMAKFIHEEQQVIGRYLCNYNVARPFQVTAYKIFLREIRWYRIAVNNLREIFFGCVSFLRQMLGRDTKA